MIAQDLADDLVTWLDSQDATSTKYYSAGDDATLDRPCVVVRAWDVEAHPVIVFSYRIALEVQLQTIAADTTEAAHRTMAFNLDELLNNTATLAAKFTTGSPTVHDVAIQPGEFDSSDGLRLFTATVNLVVVRANVS